MKYNIIFKDGYKNNLKKRKKQKAYAKKIKSNQYIAIACDDPSIEGYDEMTVHYTYENGYYNNNGHTAKFNKPNTVKTLLRARTKSLRKRLNNFEDVAYHKELVKGWIFD